MPVADRTQSGKRARRRGFTFVELMVVITIIVILISMAIPIYNRSIIRAKRGRPTDKPARGHYRRLMQTRFDLPAYRDRVQVETVISMLKRRLEAFVRGRTAWSQRREMRLKVLTHNVMILFRIQVFYTAKQRRLCEMGGPTLGFDTRAKTGGTRTTSSSRLLRRMLSENFSA